MFQVKFLEVYTGNVLANLIKYAEDNDATARYLQDKYVFHEYVSKPSKPSSWSTKRCWDDYNCTMSKYNSYTTMRATCTKYVLDMKGKFVITRNKGKIWVNYKSKKEVSEYDPDFIANPCKYLNHYVSTMGGVLVLHEGGLYIFDTENDTVTFWRKG